MRDHLQNLNQVIRASGSPPLIICGDLFNIYNPPPKLIEFALNELPSTTIYTIAGQHDLAYHDLARLNETAYGALMAAGRIQHISNSITYEFKGRHVVVDGFSWEKDFTDSGVDVEPDDDTTTRLAAIHHFAWRGKPPFPGAPVQNNIRKLLPALQRYHFAFFGDNHTPFRQSNIVNCGSMIRRTRAEIHTPACYIVKKGKNGVGVEAKELPAAADDRFFEMVDERLLSFQKQDALLKEFLSSLDKVDSELKSDFRLAIDHYVKKANPEQLVKDILLQTMEKIHEAS